MANVKISDLTSASVASGTQEFEVNDSFTSKKVSGNQLKDFINADRVEKTSDTGAALIPAGTEAQRDVTPNAGHFRFNSDAGKFEGYNGSAWGSVGGGATGGGGDEVFFENGQVVTNNYTITNGKNAMSAGPITINSGVSVTVGAGEVWTIV